MKKNIPLYLYIKRNRYKLLIKIDSTKYWSTCYRMDSDYITNDEDDDWITWTGAVFTVLRYEQEKKYNMAEIIKEYYNEADFLEDWFDMLLKVS